jgi:Acyltransferase family
MPLPVAFWPSNDPSISALRHKGWNAAVHPFSDHGLAPTTPLWSEFVWRRCVPTATASGRRRIKSDGGLNPLPALQSPRRGVGMQLLTGNHSIRSLDLLRGLAILSVVPFSHFLPIEHSIAFGLGILGVTLFFFLSGFLMGQTFAADSRIGAYVTRRVFRILPMYWISIALIFSPKRLGRWRTW